MNRIAFVLVSALLVFTVGAARAQTALTTAFTYQGELASSGTPATGTYDLRFRLYDAATDGTQIGSTLCSDNLAVDGGKFAASLDFGAGAFAGQQRYLEIEVRFDTGLGCGDASGYTVLSPRQELTASPNATFAQTAAAAATASNAANLNGQPASFFTDSANLTGTIADARLSSNIARLDANQTFTGQLTLSNPANSFTGNGAGLTNLSGSAITQGTINRSILNTDLQSVIGTAGVALGAPTSAVQVGESYRDLHVSGNRLYTTDGTQVRIYDITNPSAPTFLGFILNGSGFGGGRDIDVNGQLAAVAGPISLSFINVSNPASPSLVGSASPNFPPSFFEFFAVVALSGNYAYAGFGQNVGYLRVYDITNPASPVLRSDLATGSGPTGIAVVGSSAIMTDASGASFKVFNITNPNAVTQTTSLSLGAIRSLAISGSTAFALGADSLSLVDITNPAAPVLRSSIPVASEAMSVAVSGTYAYVASRFPGQVQVFDISNPAAPVLTFTASTGGEASEVAVTGSTLFLAENNPGTIKSFPVLPSVQTTRALSASNFVGSGSALTNLTASNLTGTIDPARLPSINAGLITSGTLSTDRLPALDAGLITSGTLGTARLPASVARTDASNAFGAFVNSFAGNVGIGTATPSRPLSFGTALGDKVALYDATNDFWGLGMTTGALQIKTGNAERMRITNSGVSIGTGANPTKVLDLYGSGNINGLRVRGDNNPSFSMGRGSTDEFEIGVASGFGNFSLSAVAGDTVIRTIANTPGKIHLQGGPNGAALTIAGTQVGINTATPTNALTVSGNMNVTGSVAKAGGSFLIDHPLDPENKFLYHSFVESPDMKNIYDGVVTTDADGYATITLPDYFEALNRDFRYQLTVIDENNDMEVFLWAKVVKKISANQFTIRSSRGNLEVSWQITGIRHDAWAEKNRIPNAVEKAGAAKGKLLHPEAFGKGAEQGIYATPVPTNPAAEPSAR
jgi:hypothetical protein